MMVDGWTCFWCADKRAPGVCTNCGPTCHDCGRQSQPFSGKSGFDMHQEILDVHPGVVCHDPVEAGLHWNPDRQGAAAWQRRPPGWTPEI